jgi:hypothetical protein
VFDLSRWIAEGRKVDLLNLDPAGFEVNNATIGIGGHLQSPSRFTLSFISGAEFLRAEGHLRAGGLNETRCANGSWDVD